MNKHIDNFAGTGMTREKIDAALADDDDAFADAVQGALSEPIPQATSGDRAIFERSIAARRQEKSRQQAIAAAAMAKMRELTASIHAMEAALDGLLVA